MNPVCLETLTFARELADSLGVPSQAVLIGCDSPVFEMRFNVTASHGSTW